MLTDIELHRFSIEKESGKEYNTPLFSSILICNFFSFLKIFNFLALTSLAYLDLYFYSWKEQHATVIKDKLSVRLEFMSPFTIVQD